MYVRKLAYNDCVNPNSLTMRTRKSISPIANKNDYVKTFALPIRSMWNETINCFYLVCSNNDRPKR